MIEAKNNIKTLIKQQGSIQVWLIKAASKRLKCVYSRFQNLIQYSLEISDKIDKEITVNLKVIKK